MKSPSVTNQRPRNGAAAEAKQRLRDLRIELSLLTHRVAHRVDLTDIELDCLDVLILSGPMNPSALARRGGIHLATMTGILNRLEAGGWIARERAENDRRAVVVKVVPDRVREIYLHYSGMNRALDKVLSGYAEPELAIIVDFLDKTTTAGRAATDLL